MNNVFKRLVDRFGFQAQLVSGNGEVCIKAFLQPITSLDKRYYRDPVTEAGTVSGMRYLYLGPADNELKIYDTVKCRGREFETISAEMIYGGSKPVCCWAVLREI